MFDELEILWRTYPETLKTYKAEVDELRAMPGSPEPDESIVRLRNRLVDTQRALDRMETLVGNLGVVMAQIQLAVDDAQAQYDDRWREVMEATRIGEYTSAQERNATYTSGSVQQLVTLRRAKRYHGEVKQMYDYALFRYRGLDKARQSIEAVIRMINVESSLTR